MSAITAERGDLPYPEACIISHASVYLFAFHCTSTNHVASSTSALFLEDELIRDGSDIAVVDVPPCRLTRTTVTKLAQRTAAIAAPATTTCLRVGLVLEEGLVRA